MFCPLISQTYIFVSYFQVVLEAAMGQSDLGDIALDDVYYYRGRCIV